MNNCDWSDYEHDRPPAVAPRRQTGPQFVQPDPAPIVPRRVEVLPPATMPDAMPAQPVKSASLVSGDYENRAKGFSHVTNRLALTLGGLGALVAVVGFSVPVFSLAVLAWFGSLYALTWFLAYVLHVFVSSEGAGFLHVLLAWRWLGREQEHRHELERRANGVEGKRR